MRLHLSWEWGRRAGWIPTGCNFQCNYWRQVLVGRFIPLIPPGPLSWLSPAPVPCSGPWPHEALSSSGSPPFPARLECFLWQHIGWNSVVFFHKSDSESIIEFLLLASSKVEGGDVWNCHVLKPGVLFPLSCQFIFLHRLQQPAPPPLPFPKSTAVSPCTPLPSSYYSYFMFCRDRTSNTVVVMCHWQIRESTKSSRGVKSPLWRAGARAQWATVRALYVGGLGSIPSADSS